MWYLEKYMQKYDCQLIFFLQDRFMINSMTKFLELTDPLTLTLNICKFVQIWIDLARARIGMC